MIDHDKKFIFIHVPRTAGTSMCFALGGAAHEHEPIRSYKDRNRSFCFAFVRHPVDRFLSQYSFYYPEMEKTIEEALLEFPTMYDLLTIDGKLAMDFVGRYENLEEDWDFIAKKFHAKPLLHHHKNEKKIEINPRVESRIREVYRKDFELWCYN